MYPRPGGPKVLEWLTVDFRRPVPSMGAFASKCMPLVSGYQHSLTPPKNIALETGRERGILQRILRRPIRVGGGRVWSGLEVSEKRLLSEAPRRRKEAPRRRQKVGGRKRTAGFIFGVCLERAAPLLSADWPTVSADL